MKKFLALIILAIGLIYPTITIVKLIQFNQNCTGYLKQTADANSVELALDRLNKAIDYVEANNLTSGYTSIIYRTEDENIEFWYKNLLTCKQELTECIESSQFEKTNVLMKVRESLTDQSENGTVITCPPGLSRYPNNKTFAFFNFFSLLIALFGSCWFLLEFRY
jgi:hypothetical protein